MWDNVNRVNGTRYLTVSRQCSHLPNFWSDDLIGDIFFCIITVLYLFL